MGGRLITLDTCALIFDTLFPEKLTTKAKKAVNPMQKRRINYFVVTFVYGKLRCLFKKNAWILVQIHQTFLYWMLDVRQIQVLSINVEIALALSTRLLTDHLDPADRIIAATAMERKASLVTCDKKLQNISGLSIIW